jgi:nitrogen fixation/metabolism regulation signal transduction histidine kinase
MKSYLYSFIIIVLILVLLAIGAGILISSRITSRISKIVTATGELGRGNLEYRLPQSNRKDELSQLMSHFNIMAEQLKENQDRLIYLEKMATWQLMARKIAHEIKNPLTPIQLTIQQLVDKYHGAGDDYDKLLHECADIINEEIGSLRHLVTEFSEFGRLPELELKNGNMNDLIREVAGLYGERVELDLNQDEIQIQFDSDRIRRVLINLLENAVQSDPGNHPVQVNTFTEADSFCLSIKDQGEGIPPEYLSRIFEPYFSEKKGGTGLGLAITRLIVEEHAGSIRVESSPGKGSTFSLTFPIQGMDTDE